MPFALICELGGQFAVQAVSRHPGKGDAARRRDFLQTGGYIYAIGIDILVLVHDVTDMDTDPQFNDLVTFQALLDVQRTTNRVNRRGEFHQPAVPHALDNLATVGGHHRFKQFTAQLP